METADPEEVSRVVEHDPREVAFEEPDPALPAWRYTTVSKLLNVLITRELPLVRVDLLGDPFEGSITQETKAHDLAMAARFKLGEYFGPGSATPQTVIDSFRRRRTAVLKSSHASCWRKGQESEGMWRLFCGVKDGVAMRTTCGKLKASITDPATRLAEVKYIDYCVEGAMPNGNYLYPLTRKRLGFADENEVRLIRFLQEDSNAVYNDPEQTGGPAVRPMRWNLDAVIDEIVVSPYAERWYFDTVLKTVEKLAPGLQGKVSWSPLRAERVL